MVWVSAGVPESDVAGSCPDERAAGPAGSGAVQVNYEKWQRISDKTAAATGPCAAMELIIAITKFRRKYQHYTLMFPHGM